MNDTEQVQRLTTELHNVTEALAASTEARLLMAGTIRDLRTENEHLRAAVARLVGLRPLTLNFDTSSIPAGVTIKAISLELPDRQPWGDGCVYHAEEAGV